MRVNWQSSSCCLERRGRLSFQSIGGPRVNSLPSLAFSVVVVVLLSSTRTRGERRSWSVQCVRGGRENLLLQPSLLLSIAAPLPRRSPIPGLPSTTSAVKAPVLVVSSSFFSEY